jgi:hypothetical protein
MKKLKYEVKLQVDGVDSMTFNSAVDKLYFYKMLNAFIEANAKLNKVPKSIVSEQLALSLLNFIELNYKDYKKQLKKIIKLMEERSETYDYEPLYLN